MNPSANFGNGCVLVTNAHGPAGVLGRAPGENRLQLMSVSKHTRRNRARKRSARREKDPASSHDRKRTGRNRNSAANDVQGTRPWSGQSDQAPPLAPKLAALQSKLDTLISLLAESPSIAPEGTTPETIVAESAPSLAPTPHAPHKELVWRLAALEAALAISPRRREPDDSAPEQTGPEPLSDDDRAAIENAIALLKAQPPEPTEPPIEALEAAQLLRAIATRRRNAVSPEQGDTPVSAVIRSDSPLWLANRISATADAAIQWINSLSLGL